MARLPRLAIPQQLHFVCQTGHNGTSAFQDATDAQTFLDALRDATSRYAVQLHAYMVLPERYGLLITPLEEGALSDFVQALGRSYARRFNRRHLRSGTVWNGRFQATLLEPHSYCWDVLTWMAGQSAAACAITGWPLSLGSSAPHYFGSTQERCITPHTLWWTIGNTPFERESAFQRQVEKGLSEAKAMELARSLGRDWVLGSDEFHLHLGSLTDRRVTKRKPGRPLRELKE